MLLSPSFLVVNIKIRKKLTIEEFTQKLKMKIKLLNSFIIVNDFCHKWITDVISFIFEKTKHCTDDAQLQFGRATEAPQAKSD